MKSNILLVDDNPANLISLRAMLEELGQNLVDASSGQEAIEKAESDRFAAILLDLAMPGLSGFETARILRASDHSRYTPIIFLTASDIERAQLEEAYGLGAVDFLGKPLLPIILQSKVRGFVELYLAKECARREAQQLRLLVHGTTEYAIFMLDPLGYVLTWNPGAERLKGYRAEEIIGQHFSRFYPQAALDKDWPAQELKCARADGRFEDEGWRVRKDGTQFWANVVITALRDEAGNLQGFSKITRDMTERKQAEDNARRLIEATTARRAAEENARLMQEQRTRLHVTLASIGDAVISTDGEGRVDFLNPVAQALIGWRPDEAIGRPLTDVFQIVNATTRAPVENPALRALRDGMIVGLANHTVLISKDATERPIDDSAAPIRDAYGNVVGSVLVFRDISERKRMDASLNERVRLLALDAAIGTALVQNDRLQPMLHRCAEALVEQLHGAFARIWTLNVPEQTLELQASAGLYTHLDGPHSRIPVGKYKIGLIAQLRRPHLTNAVAADPHISDPEWAKREGMVAFAGYPLLVDNRLVGVMAIFAREPLSDATLEAMASVANGIALGVERKIVEDERRQQQEWLRVTLASIGDAVIATDTRGRVTFLNGVAQQLTGWEESEAQGQPLENVFVILNERTRQKVENPVEKVLREGVIVGLGNHTVLVARDGRERPVDDSAAPIRDPSNAVIGVVLIFRDVTEERRAEQEVLASEARKSAILKTALDCIITMDHDGKVVEFNPAAEKTFGFNRSEVIGQELAGFIIPPALRDEHRRGMARFRETNQGPVLGQRLELPALRKDGSEFPVEISITRIAVDGPPLFTAYVRDISERRLYELAIKESEQRFRQLADAMPQIVWTAGPDGVIDYHNRQWHEFTGQTDSRGNAGWSQILHPDDAPQSRERWVECLRTGAPFEMELRLLDRRRQGYRWHLIRTVGVRDDFGKVVRWFGTSTDIDAQKRAQESSRYLAEASAALAGVVDYESTLQKVTNLAVPYFADWSALDVANDDGTLRRLAVAHQDPQKVKLVHDLMQQYPPDPAAPSGAFEVLRTGQPQIVAEITDDMLVRSARDARHLELIRSLGLKSFLCVPLTVSGQALGVLTFATAESGRVYTESDLALATELAKRAGVAIENTRLYQALRDADRRKDEFLATLAHELRNPLAPIRNSLQILKMPRVDEATVQQTREMMERQVHHLVRLVDDLLDVSRVMRGKIELRREPVELANVVARAVETAGPLIEVQGHRLDVSIPAESMILDADPVRLAQVVGNLLTNSAKYSEANGSIWLSARREGDEAVLSVRDAGIGIAPDMLPHIFELFVQADHASTKAQGGLGIGLTLVKNLLEMHGGTITGHSPGLGRGSEFIVRLPLALRASKQPTLQQGVEPQTIRPSGHRLLVVDDNKDAARSFAMLLRLQGHDVRIANDGLVALETAASFNPGLIFLDIGMPGMDGYEVARRIRQQPGLEKVILAALTGWGQQEDRHRTAEAGFDYHLVKPPEPQAVEKLLAQLDR